MTRLFSRRRFLELTATAAGSLIAGSSRAQTSGPLPSPQEGISFFLIGDTHYLANREHPTLMDEVSKAYTGRLVDRLNQLPGTRLPPTLGGGTLPEPRGVIHAGDLVDSGDSTNVDYAPMVRTEWSAFEADFGLNGSDGKLRWPVHEVHGNHDAPRGTGLVIDTLKKRNRTRRELTKASADGTHHSWDWAGVHFINAGLVVGSSKTGDLHGRYAHLESLDFVIADLTENVGNSGRPVVITHHVDVARYSTPGADPAIARWSEWHFHDVAAYHEALKPYRVAGILHGHTHVRRTFAWDGRMPAKDAAAPVDPLKGIPVFNTAKASHFSSPTQAFFHFQITDRTLVAREYTTRDGWQTGEWTPQVWQFSLPNKA